MANNVIDAAIRLRDLLTPTVKIVNASLGSPTIIIRCGERRVFEAIHFQIQQH